MDRRGIRPLDYGGQMEAEERAVSGRRSVSVRQTERRKQARRRARRRAFFLAAAELAAGVCMTMAVMAMVIPENRESGNGQFLPGVHTEKTAFYRILDETARLQTSIKGEGLSLIHS